MLSLSQARPSARRDSGYLRRRTSTHGALLWLRWKPRHLPPRRFLCGLKNEAVIKKLLQEKDLDLPKAIDIATETDIDSPYADELGKRSTLAAPVHSIRKQRHASQNQFFIYDSFSCGRMENTTQNCKCKEIDCLQCTAIHSPL